jgi:hypothetical protein
MKKLILMNSLLILLSMGCKKKEDETVTKPNRYCRFEITGNADNVKIDYSYSNENLKYITYSENRAIQSNWSHSFTSKVDNNVSIFLWNNKPLSGNFNVKLKFFVDGLLQEEVSSGTNAAISISTKVK